MCFLHKIYVKIIIKKMILFSQLDFNDINYILDDLLVFSSKNFFIFNNLAIISSFTLAVSVLVLMFNTKNLFILLINLEILLLSSMFNFLSNLYIMDSLSSQVYIFFIITVAVAESAFGLGLLITINKLKGSISFLSLNDLN
jgi:NADH:ubiquinone oxidoreductase subunit K